MVHPLQPNTRRAIPRTARTSREAMTLLEGEYRRRVTGLAEGLASGRIDLDPWQTAMQTENRRYQLASAVLGAGGATQVDAETFAIAQRKADEQVRFLNAWTDEMRAGAFPLDALPRVRQRANLYAGAANATFAESRNHRFGIPALGRHPGDGSLACRTNCKCQLDYVQVEGGWDIFWRVDPAAEHCQDCLAQAALWNPLRVRAGVIEVPL